MVEEARRKMQFTHTQLRTFFKVPNFKLVYYTLFLAKSLYGSESWNTETNPIDKKGIITRIIRKDNGENVIYNSSTMAKKGKQIYKLMFGSPDIMEDIAKLKRKRVLRDRLHLPLMPGQIAILKDLCIIFSILIGDENLEATDFLEQPPVLPNRNTDSTFTYNLKQQD